MESWQQDWVRMFETIAEEINQLFEDVGQDLTEAADTLITFSEEVAEEVEHSLEQIDNLMAPKLAQWDEQLMQWVDPLLQALLGFEATLDQAAEPITHTVEPWLNQHPVCVGCRHYHGQQYGGNLLVCAMHPYGIVDGSDSCPDKEQITWSFPRSNPNTPWDDDF